MPKMTPDAFRSLVVRRRDNCVKFRDDTLSKDRKEALQFYRGDNLALYGDSGDGLSTVVSRDTMEAVEAMLPPLVRPFVAGDEVVVFQPTGPEDEEGAKQATDYINYVFTSHNNAFRVVYDAMKDGLLYRLGVAKTVMEEEEDGETETYDELDEGQLQAVLQMGRELVGPIVRDDDSGAFTVTVAAKKVKRYKVHVISPDEFLFEERLASLCQATFLGHRKQIQLGELIEMGVDRAKAISLRSGEPDHSDELVLRFQNEGGEGQWADDDMARPVWVDECYIKCDYSGEGSLVWRKVLVGGAQAVVLLDEEADGHPYSAWTPIPVPHKLVGMGIHDLTRDIQMQKTALQREQLNNLYLVNRPQREVVDGNVNIDDLLNPQVGGIVRVKQQGSITDLTVPFVANSAFPMVEYLDGVREARTGVTRYNQGMDANSLNKTATGMNIIASASQQRQELIARQFAEFMKDIFQRLLKLVSLHGGKDDVIRLRGQWTEVDPTDWKDNYDMSVSVGLGTNNKDQLVGHMMQLMQIDERLIQLQGGGIQGPFLTADNIYSKLKRLVEAMGLKGVESYYSEPSEQQAMPQQQQQPDPSQIELQKEQIKADGAAQVARIKGEYDLAGKLHQPVMPGVMQ